MTERAVVFDIDGTLIDTKNGIYFALEEVFERYNIGEFDRSDGMKYIGPPIRESLTKFCGLSEKTAIEATEYYRTVYVQKYIENSSLYDGIEELLYKLRFYKYGISIATMKTARQVERLIGSSDIKYEFDYIETATEEGSRNKKDMLKDIAEKYGIKSGDIVMVGDTEGDYIAAVDAGTRFVGVGYGYGFGTSDNTHILCADNAREIYEYIDACFGN